MHGEPYELDDNPPRTRLRPARFSVVGFVTRSAVLVMVAGAALFVLYRREDLAGAVLGGVAAFCLLLPYFGWAEFKQDQETTTAANTMLEAHRIATEAYVQRRLDQSMDRSMAWLQSSLARDQAILAEVTAERDRLRERLKPFIGPRIRDEATGRFVSRKQLAIPAPDDVVDIVNTVLLSSALAPVSAHAFANPATGSASNSPGASLAAWLDSGAQQIAPPLAPMPAPARRTARSVKEPPMQNETTVQPIRSGWRLWLAVAFLAPIAAWIWIEDVTRHG